MGYLFKRLLSWNSVSLLTTSSVLRAASPQNFQLINFSLPFFIFMFYWFSGSPASPHVIHIIYYSNLHCNIKSIVNNF